MTEPIRPEDVAAHNERSLKTLERVIALSQGRFSLILVRCNYAHVRERVREQLLKCCSVEIRPLLLPESAKTLYTTIKAELGSEQPAALMVLGLESVVALDDLLTSTNQVRDEFRKSFSFPLLLWINDEVLQKLVKLAPDFYSWAGVPIKIAIATDELIEFLKQEADSLFDKVLDAGADRFVDNAALNLGMGAGKRFELESALKELESRGCNQPALEASQQFIFGRDAYANNQMERAQQLYEQSLTFWKQNHDLERQACLLFHLGLRWRRYAVMHRAEYKTACDRARDYYQQCVEVLQQANRPDLAAKFINALAEVLQQLEQWDELETVAKAAVALHKTYPNPIRLARAYGFLAEVAIAQSLWVKAKQYAEMALQTNDQQSASADDSQNHNTDLGWARQHHRSWYRLLLAKAQQHLAQVPAALQNLETAKVECKQEYNPQLYLRILQALRSLYFEQRRYLEAFQIKQEQLRIEQQYGFRAFIGAGYLQPQRQVIHPALVSVGSAELYIGAVGAESQPAPIAQEIVDFGRKQDVDRLIERISWDDHRLIVIHGPSGVGKSSLLTAGLVPALHQKAAIDGRNPLPVVVQAYRDWVRKLGAAVAAALGEVKDIRLSTIPDSIEAIVEQLRNNVARNLLTVLIFDQFEEFFFNCQNPAQRRKFWEFLHVCLDSLDIPYVKVILSVREDYLHKLLECDHLTNLEVTENDILIKKFRFPLGNFSPEDAKSVIQSLTQRSFYLEPALIDELVRDLAGNLGEVRPIELQVVGVQLQAENIATLVEYQQRGPKEKLVERFLEEVVKDCGPQNERAAHLVLYLLTDENNTRPLKTHAELAAALATEAKNLDLVLGILMGSGLVFRVPGFPANRYQLVHDYWVPFIRQQRGAELLAELEKAKKEQQLTQAELNRVLKRQLKAVIAGGSVMTILAVVAGILGLQARIAEIRALNSESNALFLTDDRFKALVASVKAAQRLQSIKAIPIPKKKQLTNEVRSSLLRVVYDVQEINRLEGHNNWVYGVSFSPDGQTIATASADKTVKLWNRYGKEIVPLQGHNNWVYGVSFSPDDQMIATASADKTVKLWDRDGKELSPLLKHDDRVLSVSFSPDGQTIATASWDKKVRLWNLDGKQIGLSLDHDDKVNSVSFSPDRDPDRQIIATASDDKTVRLWSRDGKKLRTLVDGSLRTPEDSPGTPENSHSDKVYSVSFSPDGETIATASWDRTVKLWNRNGTLRKTLEGHTDRVFGLSFSPDSKTIATASWDRTVKLWNRNGTLLETLKGHTDRVLGVSFSPDGEMIATVSADNTVRLWRRDSSLLPILQGHSGVVRSVSFSPDGEMIATANMDNTVKLWKRDNGILLKTLDNGVLLKTLDKKHNSGVFDVSFSPDSKTIATASADRTVKLWNLNGTWREPLRGHKDEVFYVSFSPNGQTIATASADRTVKLWRTLDGKNLKTLRSHTDRVVGVEFSPDGQLIATASDDGTAKLWKLNGTFLRNIEGHTDEVNGVSFSRDGQLIATASDDKTIKLWKLDGTLLKTLEGHRERVLSVEFSRYDQTLASASFDKTIKLWKLDGTLRKLDITLLRTFQGHDDWVSDASFSPNGKTLASASSDKTVRLWPLDSTEPQTLDLDNLLVKGCNQLHDYLKTNRNVSKSDRRLCDGIGTQK